ncbi:ATP synthase subunit C [Thiobacillus sedimenti]|uniref:ATP synthase subunit C n=1 Tax=Thiobacillus sedimenti TaxID=3110231 RepID=A0ABZ1CN13_9PROT|nr:ATP synthase subunit C [Thiobacillus sp. SCUT-2]WRS40579.1 ATP synthase subunit C [Thiobacillus sp. SCUT-2]
MTGLIACLVLPVAATLGAGIWLELKPRRLSAAWLKGGLLANVALFGLGLATVMLVGVQDVLAAEPAAAAAGGITLGQGLALLGIGLPTGLAAIAAALALGPIGSAALAVIAEKPEMFGRTLVYMGLAEGIAIYGLVMSILLLGKL